ncbi:PRKCA-binding protein-like [Huso huso]|uniref:PRKCA-binding protein-like n=1 Tax=Huso huso TaxID=61971 RepID=A0ABR0Y4A2_HUSHU
MPCDPCPGEITLSLWDDSLSIANVFHTVKVSQSFSIFFAEGRFWYIRDEENRKMFTNLDYELEEDKLGIPTVPGTVTLKKHPQNLIGISIGGGAQYCPCLYIVQVRSVPSSSIR